MDLFPSAFQILESSHTLVQVLKKEAGSLKDRMGTDGTGSTSSRDTKSGQPVPAKLDTAQH